MTLNPLPMETQPNELELSLNSLIQEHGFVSVLNGLKHLVEAKADAIGDSSDEQVEVFHDVSHSLAILIKTLPEEMDAKIALEQLTHVVADVDDDEDETRLAGGLE
ncbi:hypothetical protein [Egbenema bharatensis]|uniref:hypothetical protein n=1 Tax=Egbenema bharatensis TaxID=3463334 RepID=UPI003A893A19